MKGTIALKGEACEYSSPQPVGGGAREPGLHRSLVAQAGLEQSALHTGAGPAAM